MATVADRKPGTLAPPARPRPEGRGALTGLLGAFTYHVLAQAGAAAAVMVGATALLMRRTGAFPRWFGNTSAAIAVLLLSGLLGLAGLGVGVALLAVWVALASTVSLGAARAQPPTTPS